MQDFSGGNEVWTGVVAVRSIGEMTPDAILRSFRWVLVVAAAFHLLVFNELPALAYLAVLVLANLLGRLRTPSRDAVRLVQLLLDLGVSVWLIGWGAPSFGVDVPLWGLLLLPATEAAVHWQLVGAVSTWVLGTAAVHLLVRPEGADLLPRHLVHFSVAVAIGLLSEVTEYRLRALSRARRETAHRAALLSAVAGAARAVIALEEDEVLEAVTTAALELGFDMTEICVLSDDARELVPVIQRGWPPHHPPASQPADSGVAGQALMRRRVVVVEDYQRWDHALPLHRHTGIARSAAACPIRTGEEITAVLTVANHEVRHVTAYERECLELLATQAGVALQHAAAFAEGRRRQAELARRVTRDGLTGLSNREHLEQTLAERFERGAVGDQRMALLFVDLDQFKAVNDTFGHQTGDEVLVIVGERIRAAVRPTDIVARWGGDEFVVLVEGSPEEADRIAGRLRSSVGEPLVVAGQRLEPRVSVGVAVQRPGEDAAAVLQRADAAMYRAKEGAGGTRDPEFRA